jgi:hypothetical protein
MASVTQVQRIGFLGLPEITRKIRAEGSVATSNRPVQVTENLALFWRETDPKLKQQLQCSYPKHDWR